VTDRFHSLTVALTDDLREDDAERLIDAIKLLRGVAGVKGNVSDPGFYTAVIRAQRVTEQKLWDALHEQPLSKQEIK
jgi:hypothetical protein